MFLISSKGRAAIFLSSGSKRRVSVDWTDAPMVRPGLGATNNLRIEVAGGNAAFYINDALFYSARLHLPSGGALVGLTLSGTPDGAAVASFDDFKVADFPP